jgi:tetratricopeptide (TPR) repeat protein
MVQKKDTKNDLLSRAREAFHNNQLDHAITSYKEILRTSNSNIEKAIILAELSWAYYKNNLFEHSVEAAEQVLTFDPSYQARDDLFRIAGYAHLALGHRSLAEKYLIESIALNASDDKQQYVKFELGKLYFSQGNYDLAYPYFNDIEDFFDRTDLEYYISILFFLGFVHYYLENTAKASTCFNKILKISKDKKRKASAFYGLAYLAFKEKNYLTVISLCENAISHDPDFFDKESIGFLTASSYFYLGRIDIFNAYYYQLIKNYPNGRYQKELDKLYQSPSNKKN